MKNLKVSNTGKITRDTTAYVQSEEGRKYLQSLKNTWIYKNTKGITQ